MMTQLDLPAFLARDFQERIRLVNQACGTRLWSGQLASIWSDVLAELGARGMRGNPLARQLMRELMALAPDSQAADQAYYTWIGDDDRPVMSAPRIVYLILSCNKEQYKTKAIANHREISRHLEPLFIIIGDPNIAEAIFYGKFLLVPAPDNYEGLVRKVLESLVAVRRSFGRVGVLKIDDDTRFAAAPRHERITELIAATQYAGHLAGNSDFDRCWHVGRREHLGDEPYRRRFRGSWASGPLYYLGPEAVELLVREYLFYPGEFDGEIFGFEDKAIGDVLRARGLEPTHQELSSIFGITGPFDGLFTPLAAPTLSRPEIT